MCLCGETLNIEIYINGVNTNMECRQWKLEPDL